MPEPQTFLGFPVETSVRVPKGMALIGRFDELLDGLEVSGVIAFADQPDGNCRVFTAEALKEIATGDDRFTYDSHRRCLIARGIVKRNKVI